MGEGLLGVGWAVLAERKMKHVLLPFQFSFRYVIALVEIRHNVYVLKTFGTRKLINFLKIISHLKHLNT